MQKNNRDLFTDFITRLQVDICAALETADGKARFQTDNWERPGGGGGSTRVIGSGNVIEKGGVNISVVHGSLSEAAANHLNASGENFFACGLSLVIHPVSPLVPTVHANWRYFEITGAGGDVTDAWVGGGTDLTPWYLFDEDAIHFHQVQKASCDAFGDDLYPVFKKQCDDYFSNHHRDGERRGIGGIFFDHCRGDAHRSLATWISFAMNNGMAFTDAYLPIVARRKDLPYTAAQREWQEIRRSRYVEFNLLHDRGTLFGIRTNGRTESILMSLPPVVRFAYDHRAVPGSEEARLLEVLQKPKDWLATAAQRQTERALEA